MASPEVPRMIDCVGCCARVSDVEGATHPYIGASPGCWAVYTRVLGREYGELRNPAFHRVTVDAYAVQHPGEPSRRSIQSVAVHLISLHLVLELGVSPAFATRRIGEIVGRSRREAGGVLGDGGFAWLEPPSFAGTPNVLSVASAVTAGEHEAAVWAWARAVWGAWSAHHARVAGWAMGGA